MNLFAEVFRHVSQREVDAARRLRAAIEAFAGRAPGARRQAWALLAEPVEPAVEAERLAFRRAHAEHVEAILRLRSVTDREIARAGH